MSNHSSGVNVERLDLFQVPPRWLFLKLTTADGTVGWGEPVVEGRADTVAAAVEELTDYVEGHPSNRIEDLWQVLYRGGFYRGGPVLMSALAGIDQALWDIKGTRLGVPVYELLGGPVRDRMQVYCWVGGDKPAGVAAAAAEKVEAGYGAIKMNACAEMRWIDTPAAVDEVAQRAAAVREAVGDEVGIGIDFHGRVRRGMAKRLVRALEPYDPMFVEEPVLPENNEVLPLLQQQTSIPIATGERMFSRWDFKTVFEDRSVDVVQPDPSHAGGISELRKIATMAEAYDVALAPHCPLGPIAFAAALQVDFATLNAFIQETSLDIHYNETDDLLDYVANPEVFSFDEGFVNRPSGPGLGLQIDEEAVRSRAEVGHNWKNPIWRTDDGAIAEW